MFVQQVGCFVLQKLVTLDMMSKLFCHIFSCLHAGRNIDFYHFPPLLLTLTLAWDLNVRGKQNMLMSCSHTLYNKLGWNLVWYWSWTSCYYFWVRFNEARQIRAVLLIVSKNFNLYVTTFEWDLMKQGKFGLYDWLCPKRLNFTCICTFINWFCSSLLVWYMLLNCAFDTSLTDLDLHSRSQESGKAETSVPIIFQSFQLIWMEFGTWLRLVDLMNLLLISSSPISIPLRELYLCDKGSLLFGHLLTDFLQTLAW